MLKEIKTEHIKIYPLAKQGDFFSHNIKLAFRDLSYLTEFEFIYLRILE